MIDKGMDNKTQVLKGLIAMLISEQRSNLVRNHWLQMQMQVFLEVVVDLDVIAEPMIADQM
jgi:aconitate hydratase 2/2-methylisocitrate dehydratase